MTATTCMHPDITTDLRLPMLRPRWSLLQAVAQFGAWVSDGLRHWWANRGQTDALCDMDLRQLQDVGAPCWLQQQAAARQAMENYEYVRAMSRLRY